MMNKKSSIIIAAVVTLFAIVTITWLSCNKPKGPYTCEGVICDNGGVCQQDTVSPHMPYCLCPSGYEGANCSSAIVGKYLGTWDAKQFVAYSDSVGYAGTSSTYSMLLSKTATATTFFMNNFYNNANYSDIVCSIDSAQTTHFTIDTTSGAHMFFNNFRILWGQGTIYGSSDSIVVNMAIKFINGSSNRQHDTFRITLTPHH